MDNKPNEPTQLVANDWIDTGNLIFSKDDVEKACQLFGDENPIHNRLKVLPFALTLGAMSGRAFRLAGERGWLKEIAYVTDYCCSGELGDKALRADRIYQAFTRFEQGVKGNAQVHLRVDEGESTRFSGLIVVKYR